MIAKFVGGSHGWGHVIDISVPALVLCPMSSTQLHFGLHAARHAHCYGKNEISCETQKVQSFLLHFGFASFGLSVDRYCTFMHTTNSSLSTCLAIWIWFVGPVMIHHSARI